MGGWAYSQAGASVHGLVASVHGLPEIFCIILDFSVQIDWQGVGLAPLESLVTLFFL